MRFLLHVLISALALWVAAWILPGVSIAAPADTSGTGATVVSYLVLGLIFGLVNAIVKPIVKFITGIAYILTLGLFTLIVNGLMLELVKWIAGFTPLTFTIDSFFWDAILAAIIVSVVSFFASLIVGRRDRRSVDA